MGRRKKVVEESGPELVQYDTVYITRDDEGTIIGAFDTLMDVDSLADGEPTAVSVYELRQTGTVQTEKTFKGVN